MMAFSKLAAVFGCSAVCSVSLHITSGTENSTEVLMSSSPASIQDRVLIVDVRGPTRVTGDGVRVMGMLMDLSECGHHIEVISDYDDYSELKQSWSHDVAETYFEKVHFWTPSERTAGEFDIHNFNRIIVGGKLDLLYTGAQAGRVVLPILKALHDEREKMRNKVVAFWDDVPFERCLIKPEAATICPKVPDFVKMVSEAAHKFYVLSVDDKERILDDMAKHSIPTENLEVSVWPMSIDNMQSAIPNLRFTGASAERNLVTMMGNLHAVNKMMVNTLFDSGAMYKICNEIALRGSPVRVMFMGGLAEAAAAQVKERPASSSCVTVQAGFVSDQELEHSIFPKTRAVLNPFFADVNSGISVKNFESIMSGVPVITSPFGMHGLSDEVPECANFAFPASPSDADVFAKFFIDNVVDNEGYVHFAETFAENAPKCIAGQRNKYPTSRLC